jgi:Protein of unknown function (DUF2934)
MAETPKKTKAPAKPKSTALKAVATENKEDVNNVTAAPPTKSKTKAAKTAEVTAKVTSTAATGPQSVPTKAKTMAEKAPSPAPSREQIAQLAHRFWKERGGHHGSHEQDWFRAERELHGIAS